MARVKPFALDALLVAAADFYAARGASDDKGALRAAERVCALVRTLGEPSSTIAAQVTVGRSLWRLAKAGELDAYLRQKLSREFAARLFELPGVREAVRVGNMTVDGQPTIVPKHMHYHTADLRLLVVPIEEDKL